jgi:hypothetical protein
MSEGVCKFLSLIKKQHTENACCELGQKLFIISGITRCELGVENMEIDFDGTLDILQSSITNGSVRAI